MKKDGTVLHRWRNTYRGLFPDDEDWESSNHKKYFRDAHLYPNGDLLVIFEGSGIARLDVDSEVMWSAHNGAHHEAEVAPDGDVYVLTRLAHLVEDFHPKEPVLEDFVSILGPDGVEKRRVSLLKALRESDHQGLVDLAWRSAQAGDGDILHTNDLDLIDLSAVLPNHSGPGALLSFRTISTVAVLDFSTDTIVWALAGLVEGQHDPSLLPNGNLLVFDNRDQRLGSRAVEIDPRTQQIVWSFPEDRITEFYSSCCGNAYRLTNGNTLVNFASLGRVMEVTEGGEIAWEFATPHRAGEQDKFIAQVLLMEPISADIPMDWLFD